MINQLWSMAAAASCTVCLMPVVISARTFGHDQIASLQHVHLRPTSRLGGGILFLAYAAGLALGAALDLAPSRPILLPLACALPIFIAGIWEDVTRDLPPRQRLLAALMSAILASALAGGVIARLDLPYVDGWLIHPLFAVLLTCFMVVGACNALNLIDGANGLAGGTALLMFGGLAVAAVHSGDKLVLVQAVTMIGALAGFLYWNYPRARVFMGDGGAYFVGFIYAELSIQIVARNAGISAWFVIMLAAYPIVETLYSIFRRKLLLHTPSTQPDALHLHSLIYHRVTLPAEQGRPDCNHDCANARVAPQLWLHGLLCFALALIFHDNTGALLVSLAGYVIVYIIHYGALLKFRSAPADEAALDSQDRRDANTN